MSDLDGIAQCAIFGVHPGLSWALIVLMRAATRLWRKSLLLAAVENSNRAGRPGDMLTRLFMSCFEILCFADVTWSELADD